MIIDKVKVTVGRTVATPVKFEFLRIDTGLEATIEPDEDRKKIRIALRKECMAAVNGMIAKELVNLYG